LANPIDTERRLVAIFAADVKGYSRLMGTNEVQTLLALTQRRTILDGLISAHRGRIANTAGDSVLAEFGSAVDAVQCAVEAQGVLAEANASLSPDRHINFRIGVHVGDVMIKGGDLFGDGVNIAARLQTLASAGGTCISSVAHDQVRKILPFSFTDLGTQQLKNISEPVRAFAVSAKDTSADAASPDVSIPLPLPDRPSIAVLPFQNMSGDPEQEYFADGMVEDIITGLSRSKTLFVIARNSSFTYKGKAVDIKQVGRELGVRYVLEGSVRKAGNRVRITGQLIDASTGMHLWADRFEGSIEDIFDLQDQVTVRVVGAIAPKLQQAEIERAKRKPTENLDAYDYLLRGLANLHRSSKEANSEALRLFYKAVEFDFDLASAHAMAAYCYVWRKANGWMVDRERETAETVRLAFQGAKLGKDDAVALCTSGFALARVAGNLDDGTAFIDQALAVNPNLATAWGFSGRVRVYRGEPEAAIEHLARAMRLSPLDSETYGFQGSTAFAHFFCDRNDEASAWAEKAIRENPNFLPVCAIAAASSAFAGRLEAAKLAMVRLRQIDPGLRVTNLKDQFPLRRAEDLAKFAEGLRKAGLPE
jgi:TolB-like protein/class 3 adenylate cyclase/tetratricopeptide (TPR) repeat protein